jgi:glutaredoxin
VALLRAIDVGRAGKLAMRRGGVSRWRLALRAKCGDNGGVTSWYRAPPAYLTLTLSLLGACSEKSTPQPKLRCAVSIEDAGTGAAANSMPIRSTSRPPGWLRSSAENVGDAGNARSKRLRGEVLYLDAGGNLVRARNKNDVPPEFRSAMVARSGGLGAPGSYSVIDFGKLPDPPKKVVPAAQPAQTASEKRPAAGEKPSVKIFGTSWCQACQMTKSYLAGKDVPFAMRDIEGDSAALAEYMSYGGNEVPLVVIGETVIRGFVPSEIDRALGL